MTWSPLSTEIRPTSQQSGRSIPPRMAVLHHGATQSLEAILSMMAGGKQVSAHQGVKDGRLVGVVDENARAWSLSDAYWDSAAFTVECANESTNGWTISQASHESLAQLVADWSKRYGFPIIRTGDPKTWTVIGHREVYTIHGGSYATACPGGMDLDWIATRAQQIRSGSTAPAPTPKDDTMARIINLKETLDGAANTPTIFFDGGAGVGIKGIASPAHKTLLERYIADVPGDHMFPIEIATINSYLAPAAPALDPVLVKAAIESAVKSLGVFPSKDDIAKAVDAALADNFAAIPAAVNTDAAERLKN